MLQVSYMRRHAAGEADVHKILNLEYYRVQIYTLYVPEEADVHKILTEKWVWVSMRR